MLLDPSAFNKLCFFNVIWFINCSSEEKVGMFIITLEKLLLYIQEAAFHSFYIPEVMCTANKLLSIFLYWLFTCSPNLDLNQLASHELHLRPFLTPARQPAQN